MIRVTASCCNNTQQVDCDRNRMSDDRVNERGSNRSISYSLAPTMFVLISLFLSLASTRVNFNITLSI